MGEILEDLTTISSIPTETRDEFQTVEIVFMGRRAQGTKAELLEAYIPLQLYNTFKDDSETLESIRNLFGIPKHREVPAIVGGVYDMECIVIHNSIQKARNGRWVYKYRIFDTEQVAAWQQADREAWAKGAERRALVKIKNDDLLETNMQFLRAAYQKCNPAERIGFEMAVMRRLRSS